MMTPEQKQPARIPIVRRFVVVTNWLCNARWPVTALLHEALHLPKFRTPAQSGRVLRRYTPLQEVSARGLADVRANDELQLTKLRRVSDRQMRILSRNLIDAPSGSPIHRCHAPFEVNCWPPRAQFRVDEGIDPLFSL